MVQLTQICPCLSLLMATILVADTLALVTLGAGASTVIELTRNIPEGLID